MEVGELESENDKLREAGRIRFEPVRCWGWIVKDQHEGLKNLSLFPNFPSA
jgi:hypothetical protein